LKVYRSRARLGGLIGNIDTIGDFIVAEGMEALELGQHRDSPEPSENMSGHSYEN
jgi:hypothetical protein